MSSLYLYPTLSPGLATSSAPHHPQEFSHPILMAENPIRDDSTTTRSSQEQMLSEWSKEAVIAGVQGESKSLAQWLAIGPQRYSTPTLLGCQRKFEHRWGSNWTTATALWPVSLPLPP